MAENLINERTAIPLIRIVQKVIIEDRRKLMMFAHFPMIQFHLEAFLKLLGFHVFTLRAGMSMSERINVAEKFKRPKPPPGPGGDSPRYPKKLRHCIPAQRFFQPRQSQPTFVSAKRVVMLAGYTEEIDSLLAYFPNLQNRLSRV